jgi:hypothetical protein
MKQTSTWHTPYPNPKNLPVIPRLPEGGPKGWNDPVAMCGECGREIHRVESYSCQNSRCPVQPKITC